MAKTVIVDSGVIVAALLQRDLHHAWAKANLQRMTGACLTCEAVLSECFYLLEKVFDGGKRLSVLLERGILRVDFALPDHLPHVLQLIHRYHDTPMSLADACLVRMSELHGDALVWTTDHDFEVYRRNGRRKIPLLAPWW
jgi:predicted nucleic acid-binding protein